MMANWATGQNSTPIKISGVIQDAESKMPVVGEISFNYKGENSY